MIQILKKSFKMLFGIQKRELTKKLKFLLEEEFLYVYPDFSLELLENKTGFDQKSINVVLMKMYNRSFYHLKRHLRVKFLRDVIIEDPGLGLNDYAYFAGYEDFHVMVKDVKLETGLDFEDFCYYAQNDIA